MPATKMMPHTKKVQVDLNKLAFKASSKVKKYKSVGTKNPINTYLYSEHGYYVDIPAILDCGHV